MPKMKTRKSAAKRYRVSGSGKIMRRKGNCNHLMECKTPKCKSRKAGHVVVDKTDAIKIAAMLPYAW